ncbi:MAG: DUF4126 domain-containing protein, partial [Chloroflexi bacterium]|nr:DUF4126 domain-containing protein [Chloroflexota bacterium]
GLNAYLPLLIVGLVARFTNLIKLNEPFDLLTNGWVLGVVGALLLIEIFVDKVPAVDTVNDIIQTFVRPAAGAILFAAASNTIADIHPVLAMICGILAAGSVHAVKATARPVVTTVSAGTLNPVVSAAEDVVSGTVTVVSIIVPLLGVALLVLLLILFLWWRRKRET